MATSEMIEAKIDRPTATGIAVARGGMELTTMGEAMELAKLMAVSQTAVPPHCRNNPGICLAICIQSMEWRMSPFAVANKSYVVNDRLSFESQLIHAVIEQRAPITARLRHSFSGKDESRRCKVWATAEGEAEPLEYESPEFGKILPKNSPLWRSKPDLQLFYNTSRDWARVYFPDVIMGVYSDDEVQDSPAPAQVMTISQITERIAAHNDDSQLEATPATGNGHSEDEAPSRQAEAENAKSEAEGPQEPAEPVDGLKVVRDEFAKCKSEKAIDKVYDAAMGPDSSAQWTQAEEKAIEAMRAEATSRVAAAKAKGKGGELFENKPGAVEGGQ